MVAPLEPPLPSLLSKVPDWCQAKRIPMGHAFALPLITAFRTDDFNESTKKVDEKSTGQPEVLAFFASGSDDMLL